LHKSVSNITLQNISSEPYPGASIMYVIIYSNIGSSPAKNVVIADKLPSTVVYLSNSNYADVPGWVTEWSTNLTPVLDYTNISSWMSVEPEASKVKWIRWKKSSIGITEDGGHLSYKVIIK